MAVLISTVALESTFSTSSRTLNPVESSLNDESIIALIYDQDWLRTLVINIFFQLLLLTYLVFY
jgi:hAT family C-terminal dimerisation region